MLISRHIIFIDTPAASWRQELRYDPRLEIDLSLGKVSSVLNSQMAPKGTTSGSLRKRKPIINANGILHINEVMKAGETISIVLRPSFRLKDVVLAEANQLQILVNEQSFHYWFTIGQDGVIDMTGSLVRDEEGYFGKLQKNLKDIPFRSYIVQRTLADTKVTQAALDKPPDLMVAKEAAMYLRISLSKFYKMSAAGEIGRTVNNRFRLVDLDEYLARDPKRGKRQ